MSPSVRRRCTHPARHGAKSQNGSHNVRCLSICLAFDFSLTVSQKMEDVVPFFFWWRRGSVVQMHICILLPSTGRSQSVALSRCHCFRATVALSSLFLTDIVNQSGCRGRPTPPVALTLALCPSQSMVPAQSQELRGDTRTSPVAWGELDGVEKDIYPAARPLSAPLWEEEQVARKNNL